MQARFNDPRPQARADLQDLRQKLTTLLGPQIGVACTGVDGDPQTLWPVEREAVLKAVPRRQREFAAGRAAAREAMLQMDWPAVAIPSAADRSPTWPHGLVGSIAHSRDVCVAIAGRRNPTHGMGIDIEEDLEMDTNLWPSICTPGELATVEALPRLKQGLHVTRLFCAKEAYYKWQFPQTGRMLNFLDVQVVLNNELCRFSARPVITVGLPIPFCTREGHLMTSQGLVLALLIGPPASHIRDG